MRLTDEERALAALIDFEIDLCQLIKDITHKPLERALRFELDGEAPANGLSVKVRVDVIVGFIQKFQRELTAGGYSTFWSLRSEGRRPRDEMVVLKTLDDREIVRWRRTAGPGQSPSTADILAAIDRWAANCRLHVVGAGADWLALSFDTLPGDMCAFADDVARFCTNAVEQNVGDDPESDTAAVRAARRLCPQTPAEIGVKRLAHYIQESRSLFLWWD